MLTNLFRRTALFAGLAAATFGTATVASAQGFWAQVFVGAQNASYGTNIGPGGGFVSPGTITVLSGGTEVAGLLTNFTVTTSVFTIDKFFCTDRINNITLPSTYVAWISYISTSGDMLGTRLGSTVLEPGVTANQVYTQNASLAGQMQINAFASNNALQLSMWANVESAPLNPAVTYTNNGDASFNANNWFVVTSPKGVGQVGGKQELLAHFTSTPPGFQIMVPEPGTFALLAPSLLAVGFMARRRRSAQMAS